jgi:hypothetical protein
MTFLTMMRFAHSNEDYEWADETNVASRLVTRQPCNVHWISTPLYIFYVRWQGILHQIPVPNYKTCFMSRQFVYLLGLCPKRW